ncbi:MAG: peptidase M20, partial [Pyrinomonadaceae bacterium]
MKQLRCYLLLFAIATFFSNHLFSQSPIRLYRQANEHRLLSDFMELLKLPNIASDTANIRKNADYLVAEMQKRGLKPRLLEAADKAVPPVVYGEWITPGATKTVIFYAHYDG